MGKNDHGWEKVLEAKGPELEECGHFYLSSAELKRISGREPRLMAKHDFSTARPAPFGKELNILPVSRRGYLVGKFNLFHPFEEISSPVKTLKPLNHLESFGEISSESKALNAAVLAGALDDFLGPGPYPATVNGRMSTNVIDLNIDGLAVTVDRAQMEIDGGYESPSHLVLVEAKNHITKDFNIRQLYFPFRRFQQEISKPVVPLYLVYSNGVFNFYRYRFSNPADFRSIELADCARYTLEPTRLTAQYLYNVVEAVRVEPSPDPFPQADSLARVINLIELINGQALVKADIAEEYGFTPRQAHYYTAAARYLGLLNQKVELTPAGHRLANTNNRTKRNVQLVTALAARPVFHQVLEKTFSHGAVPPADTITQDLIRHGLGPTTAHRRARTVGAWATWALDLTRETPAGLNSGHGS